MSAYQTHSEEYLKYLRAFVEAVLAYTGAEKVDIISHSMGVTLGRGVLKGGKYPGPDGEFDLGSTLSDKVDTFVGIAGANYGLVNCYLTSVLETCNYINGFYPGDGPNYGLSQYLDALNKNTQVESSHSFSIFSTWDDLIGYGDEVYGRFTSEFPTEDSFKKYETYEYTHIGLRDETVADQYSLVRDHVFPSSAEKFL